MIILSALSLKDKNTFLVSIFVSFVLYPPIIIFIGPAILFFIFDQRNLRVFIKTVTLSFLLFFAVVLISYLAIGKNGFIFAVSQIIRTNLDGGIPYFAIWNVFPFFVLFFVILGFWDRFKNKDFVLLAPILSGLIFWVFYTNTTKVFLIDYPRVVVITSVLLVCLVGFGFDFFIDKFKINKDSTDIFATKFLFIVFFLFSMLYYTNDSWRKMFLKINEGKTEKKVMPASPINRYLNQEDIKIFSDIRYKTFMAPPWKGLVLGVVTDNYPTESKTSVISNNLLSYDKFMSFDCEKKKSVSQKLKIDYVYSKPFSCDNFILMASSSEGLFLYKTKK